MAVWCNYKVETSQWTLMKRLLTNKISKAHAYSLQNVDHTQTVYVEPHIRLKSHMIRTNLLRGYLLKSRL